MGTRLRSRGSWHVLAVAATLAASSACLAPDTPGPDGAAEEERVGTPEDPAPAESEAAGAVDGPREEAARRVQLPPRDESGRRAVRATLVALRPVDPNGNPWPHHAVGHQISGQPRDEQAARGWPSVGALQHDLHTDVEGRLHMVVPTLHDKRGEEFEWSIVVRMVSAEGEAFWARADLSTPLPGGVLDLGDVDLERGQALVRGTVVDERGEPVAGANVFLEDSWPYDPSWKPEDEIANWEVSAQVLTGEDGRFAFDVEDLVWGPGHSPLRVRAEVPGKQPATLLPFNQPQQQERRLQFAPGGRVRVQLEAAEGLLEGLGAYLRLASTGAEILPVVAPLTSQVLAFDSHRPGQHRIDLISGSSRLELGSVVVPASAGLDEPVPVRFELDAQLAPRRVELLPWNGGMPVWTEIRALPGGPLHTPRAPLWHGPKDLHLLLPRAGCELEILADDYAIARVTLGPFDPDGPSPCAVVPLRPVFGAEVLLEPAPRAPEHCWFSIATADPEGATDFRFAGALDAEGRGIVGARAAGVYRLVLRIEGPNPALEHDQDWIGSEESSAALRPTPAWPYHAARLELPPDVWAQEPRVELRAGELPHLAFTVDAERIEALARAWRESMKEQSDGPR